jgi:hypothetical protein
MYWHASAVCFSGRLPVAAVEWCSSSI